MFAASAASRTTKASISSNPRDDARLAVAELQASDEDLVATGLPGELRRDHPERPWAPPDRSSDDRHPPHGRISVTLRWIRIVRPVVVVDELAHRSGCKVSNHMFMDTRIGAGRWRTSITPRDVVGPGFNPTGLVTGLVTEADGDGVLTGPRQDRMSRPGPRRRRSAGPGCEGNFSTGRRQVLSRVRVLSPLRMILVANGASRACSAASKYFSSSNGGNVNMSAVVSNPSPAPSARNRSSVSIVTSNRSWIDQQILDVVQSTRPDATGSGGFGGQCLDAFGHPTFHFNVFGLRGSRLAFRRHVPVTEPGPQSQPVVRVVDSGRHRDEFIGEDHPAIPSPWQSMR